VHELIGKRRVRGYPFIFGLKTQVRKPPLSNPSFHYECSLDTSKRVQNSGIEIGVLIRDVSYERDVVAPWCTKRNDGYLDSAAGGSHLFFGLKKKTFS